MSSPLSQVLREASLLHASENECSIEDSSYGFRGHSMSLKSGVRLPLLQLALIRCPIAYDSSFADVQSSEDVIEWPRLPEGLILNWALSLLQILRQLYDTSKNMAVSIDEDTLFFALRIDERLQLTANTSVLLSSDASSDHVSEASFAERSSLPSQRHRESAESMRVLQLFGSACLRLVSGKKLENLESRPPSRRRMMPRAENVSPNGGGYTSMDSGDESAVDYAELRRAGTGALALQFRRVRNREYSSALSALLFDVIRGMESFQGTESRLRNLIRCSGMEFSLVIHQHFANKVIFLFSTFYFPFSPPRFLLHVVPSCDI